MPPQCRCNLRSSGKKVSSVYENFDVGAAAAKPIKTSELLFLDLCMPKANIFRVKDLLFLMAPT